MMPLNMALVKNNTLTGNVKLITIRNINIKPDSGCIPSKVRVKNFQDNHLLANSKTEEWISVNFGDFLYRKSDNLTINIATVLLYKNQICSGVLRKLATKQNK